jgi:hypothetical protein
MTDTITDMVTEKARELSETSFSVHSKKISGGATDKSELDKLIDLSVAVD